MATITEVYNTNELELASFLKAKGHKLLGIKPMGYEVIFSFARAAGDDVGTYFQGAELPAADLFEAHRSLRVLISQLRKARLPLKAGRENEARANLDNR